MPTRNEPLQPADAGPVERPVRPHFTVRACVWNGMAWTISATVPTQMRFGAKLYDQAALDAAVAAERANNELLSEMLAQERLLRLHEVAAERERCAAALRIAREGYASEAVTGLPVLPQWRERVLALIDDALKA